MARPISGGANSAGCKRKKRKYIDLGAGQWGKRKGRKLKVTSKRVAVVRSGSALVIGVPKSTDHTHASGKQSMGNHTKTGGRLRVLVSLIRIGRGIKKS